VEAQKRKRFATLLGWSLVKAAFLYKKKPIIHFLWGKLLI
jgi:hypothetical protein